jgi:predicted O-linked N-acetylglucosamine transferase (SPINDLY family)
VTIWAELLKRVPGSRLLLKSAAVREESSRQRILGQFAERGVAGERIEILGWAKHPNQHLVLYERVDVALDTYPYHGTTTTCEALWMGVPVVSLAGKSHVSRVGVSLLSCVGLPELIAQSAEEYISIAAELAANESRLKGLRATLRNQLKSSPLVDGSRFTTKVESAYRQMWRTGCAKGSA